MLKSAVSQIFLPSMYSVKLMDLLNRWQGRCVPSYFYQSKESFMLVPTVFSEILKVIACSVENLSCIETRESHPVVLAGVTFR